MLDLDDLLKIKLKIKRIELKLKFLGQLTIGVGISYYFNRILKP